MLVVLKDEIASPNEEDYIIPKLHLHPNGEMPLKQTALEGITRARWILMRLYSQEHAI